MNMYRYCAGWARSNASPGAKVLDYGCGAGTIVQMMIEKGVEAYGCDVFYDGGDYSRRVPPVLLENGTIRRMEGDRIPFEDESFDLIVNNQVLEHVPDLDLVLQEMARVLKPGGRVLSLFPDRSVWRERHCGIPFLHWFPKLSRSRVYYAYALRSLGLGHHKKNKPKWQWSEDFCTWLDNWTYYRPRKIIHDNFRQRIGTIRNLEVQCLTEWLGSRAWLVRLMPAFVSEQIVHKMACLVFETTKPGRAG
ncbi:class I SAM-dependent methyltransferase [Ferrovibrio terrae]|nr:class I SAM-dependent methyltransferase [Ferrovibrio terrae]